MVPESKERGGNFHRPSYVELSGGLLLNTTSIISGTSKDNEEGLEASKRLQNKQHLKPALHQVKDE